MVATKKSSNLRKLAFGLLLILATMTIAGQQAAGRSLAPQASETAKYKIVFTASWGPDYHQDPNTTFPSNPHFSGLIGASHNANTVIWEVGGLATDGIEDMAETGSTNQLRSEINNNSNADQIVSGGSIPNSPGSATINSVTFDHDYPLVTLVTMIAPSPDWFVGVSGLSLIDSQGGWINEIEVDLFPYDAGTDSGTFYTSSNQNTNPPQPISSIKGVSPLTNERLGTFKFTRLDGPDPTLTPTPTSAPTETPIPTETVVPTEAPTATPSPTETATATATSTATPTTTPTATLEPTATATETAEPPTGGNETAVYHIIFDATWDPTGVPFPHFSPLVGATHNENTAFWQVGSLVSDGTEVMAETGGTSTLKSEIAADPNADVTIMGSGIGSPGSTTVFSVTVDVDYPLLTLVTMIAPSPDWFVGVSDLSLVDGDGDWRDEVVVELRPYDAGTDSGQTFTSPNEDTVPPEPIFLIDDEALFPEAVLGTFTITRADKPPFTPTDFIYLPLVNIE